MPLNKLDKSRGYNLRFSEFNNDYIKTSLKEISTLSMGRDHFSRKDMDNKIGSIECIHYGDLNTSLNIINNSSFFKTNFEGKVFTKKNDVLISIALSGNKNSFKWVSIKKNGILLSQLISVFSIKDEFDSDYISLILNSKKYTKKIQSLVQGTVASQLFPKDLKKISFSVSEDKNEQNKIVYFYKQLIEKTNYTKSLEDQFKKISDAVINKLFQKFYNTTFNSLEEKQKLFVPIRKLIDLYSRYNKDKKTYPCYSIGSDGIKINDRIKDVELFIKNKKIDPKIISYKDFAFNPWTIQSGLMAQNKYKNDGLISDHYITFKLKNIFDINHDYFVYFFKSKYFKKNAKKKSLRGVRFILNKTNFVQIKIPIPSRDEQDKIATLLNNINKIIEINKKLLNLFNTAQEELSNRFF